MFVYNNWVALEIFIFNISGKNKMSLQGVECLGDTWERLRLNRSPPHQTCWAWPESSAVRYLRGHRVGRFFGISLIVLYLKGGMCTHANTHAHTEESGDEGSTFKASATNSNHLTNQRVKWCIPPPPQPPFLPSFRHISKHLYHFSSGGTWKEPRGPWRSLSASRIFKLQTIFPRAGQIFKWNI